MNTLKISDTLSLDSRCKELLATFNSKFGEAASVVLRVPGRVNLIGEHIDYCGYAVHPMAIEQDILLAVGRNKTDNLDLHNLDDAKYPSYKHEGLKELEVPKDKPIWWAYFLCGLKGVQEEMNVSDPMGLKVLMTGSIPPSAGLSSSSALVVSAALTSVWSNNLLPSLSREELASLCARAERFIGTQGGGMDQAIELLAQAGSAKLIEFNPLRTFNVSLPAGATFVVANSLEEKNKAASNDFNTRVVECRLATKILAKLLLGEEEWKGLTRLREVQERVGVEVGQMVDRVSTVLHEEDYNLKEITNILGVDADWVKENILTENTKHLISFRLYQRAKHVYSEAARVYQFKDICGGDGGEGALQQLGDLMAASHSSCSNLYQCSSTGLDKLVSLAMKHGALGARLTGAGWGGCIVALVKEESAGGFIKNIKEDYYKDMELTSNELKAAIFVTKPGDGAQVYDI